MMDQIFYTAFVEELNKLAEEKPKKPKPANKDGVKVTVNVGKDDKKPGKAGKPDEAAGPVAEDPVVTDEHRQQVDKVQGNAATIYKDLLKRKPPPRLTDVTAEDHFKHKDTLRTYSDWLSQKMEADKST